MSGLALGALAFGVVAAAPMAEPSAERGVLGGTVLGGTSAGRPELSPSGLVEARLRLSGSQFAPGEPAFGDYGGLPGAASVRGLW